MHGPTLAQIFAFGLAASTAANVGTVRRGAVRRPIPGP